MGRSFGDIALLSARNEDLTALALFLTKRRIPVLTSTAKGFSKKRILLDCLFLYKFLINPWDTENLAALCRTPYFLISDEKLSHIINNFSQEGSSKEPSSAEVKNLSLGEKKTCSPGESQELKPSSHTKGAPLWEHCLRDFSNEKTVKSLKSYLELRETLGLLPAFEKAIFQNILGDNNILDPTGTDEANIWKLLKHLYKRRNSQHHPLDFYYSFLSENLSDEEAMEAPAFISSDAIRLLTIHGSKGLEFENVIIFNLSRGWTVPGSEVVYDSERNKITFSVPDGERNQTKIKCHGHKKINDTQKKKKIEEMDRLLYVAMTRARNSLALLVPEEKPLKNSWFERFDFFKNFLKPEEDGLWKIKGGLYKRENYSFLVERVVEGKLLPLSSVKDIISVSDSLSSSFSSKTSQREVVGKNKDSPGIFKSSRDFILFSLVLESEKKKNEEDRESVVETVKEKNHQAIETAVEKTSDQSGLSFEKNENLKNSNPIPINKAAFHPTKVVNTFIKAQLGSQLHHYLRLLGKESLEKVRQKIETSFLFPEEKQKLKEAMNYVVNLKNPHLSFFLEKGFSEWPFKLQRGNVVLQGQMDLWGRKRRQIHLFDYKSSLGNREHTKKQLAFYGYVLDQLYHPESVKCFGVYPFQKKTEEYPYSSKEKEAMSLWLKSFECYTHPV